MASLDDSGRFNNIEEYLEDAIFRAFIGYGKLPCELHLGEQPFKLLVSHIKETIGSDYSDAETFNWRCFVVRRRPHGNPLEMYFLYGQFFKGFIKPNEFIRSPR